jgi:ubiquinone/menaquinone biosynthesis C-methylase UbiE
MSPMRSKLIYLLTYKFKSGPNSKKIIDILHDSYNQSDKQIYDKIRELEFEPLDEHRGQYRINVLNKYIFNWREFSPTMYLDVGCFRGDITRTIGDYFNLGKNNIYGIDIKKYIDTSDFTYIVYDGQYIPLEDNTFDLVTCFMILHHIPPQNLNILLREIFRVMKSGGKLILREHNAESADKNLLDVLHEYYDYVLDRRNKWELNKNYYNNNIYWATKFSEAGFVCDLMPEFKYNSKKNPFNNYLCSFAKP